MTSQWGKISAQLRHWPKAHVAMHKRLLYLINLDFKGCAVIETLREASAATAQVLDRTTAAVKLLVGSGDFDRGSFAHQAPNYGS